MPLPVPLQQELPLARVQGEALFRLPEGLYIPPDALEIFLETFEGPLDLLLYLIKRQNLDILDIPVAAITRQYMAYVELMQDSRFELAAEYLVMAATLAEIKSRLLLPKPASTDEESEDPRAELIRRLRDYEQFKQAGERLDHLPRLGRDLALLNCALPPLVRVPLPSSLQLDELLQALRGLLARARLFEHHQVSRELLSTRERMSAILARLSQSHDGFLPFTLFFTVEEGRLGVVVTFLAVMELVKEGLVMLLQNAPLAPIHLQAKRA